MFLASGRLFAIRVNFAPCYQRYVYIYIYIYITYQKILSKAKKDRSIRVNLQRVLAEKTGFFQVPQSSFVNNQQDTRPTLSFLAYGWYIIEKIQWNCK